jgi:hypothetical protein
MLLQHSAVQAPQSNGMGVQTTTTTKRARFGAVTNLLSYAPQALVPRGRRQPETLGLRPPVDCDSAMQ